MQSQSQKVSDHKSTKKHKISVKRLQNSPYAISTFQTIGSGAFSVIHKAYNIQKPSEQLAVKIISISDQQSAITIKSELQMLKELPHHPNLVNNIKIQISTQRNFYIFMQYCNQGNLEKYINTNTQGNLDISQQKIWFFLKQISEGYEALYQKNIIHRDIKPENILIHNGDFKIGDFGLSKVIQNVQIRTNMSSKGTPIYMAPELHLQKQGSAKVDIFSVGIILYRMAFKGKFPFFQKNRNYHSINNYFQQLMIKKLVFPQKHTRSAQLVHLIERMVEKNPEKRISWKQIFQMQRIKRAVRNQRRKQMISMDQFKRRSLYIANTSIAKVQKIQLEGSSQQNAQSSSVLGNKNNEQQQKKQNYLIIQQAFLKKDRSNLQRKIYHNKLLYTLIDIANRRMAKVTEKQRQSLHPYIIQQIQGIILSGIEFSLYIITRLQDISGDWTSISKGEMMNFEDIFESDRQIILEKLRLKDQNIAQKYIANRQKYHIGVYEQKIYQLITQYFQYPKNIKQALKIVISFLLQIYDLVMKYHEEYEQNHRYSIQEKTYGVQQKLDNWLQKLAQESQTDKFQQYLFKVIQQRKPEEMVKKMKQMGLLIL